jgi:hypothetical protein
MVKFFKKYKGSLFLILVLLLAFFFCFWQLSRIPPGLYPDVAVNGMDAIGALRTHDFKIFYPANNGREGLFINLIALSFGILGTNILAIKVVSALFGLLTVLGIYLLVKELFNRKIALLSSFFLSVCFWHVNFSRIGFRAVVLPFILVYSFYFLFRGIRTKRFFYFILGGLFFGLGLHTYISFRLVPLILIAWVLIKIILDKKFWRTYWLRLAVFILSSIISASPLLYYFLVHPADFMGRAGDVSVFRQPEALKLIVINLVKSAAMFNFYGDLNWRHNLAGAPMFSIPLGLLFLGGLLLVVIKIIKRQRGDRFFAYLFLLLWFAVMLLPTVLSSEGIPHALRALGALPVCLIFAALFTDWLFNLEFWSKRKKHVKTIALVILLIIVAGLESHRYFIVWAQKSETHQSFAENLVNIGNYLNSLPQATLKYVLVNEQGVLVDNLPMPAQTVKFITYQKSFPKYLLPADLKRINFFPTGTVIIFMQYDKSSIDYLKKHFENGQVEIIDLEPGTGTEFWVFSID